MAGMGAFEVHIFSCLFFFLGCAHAQNYLSYPIGDGAYLDSGLGQKLLACYTYFLVLL